MIRPQTGWIPADASPQYLIAESIVADEHTQYAVYQIDSSWTKNYSKPSTNTIVEVDESKLPQPRHLADFDLSHFGEEYRMWPPATPP